MLYVFDTDTLITIFRYYYISRFPTFWDKFNLLVASKQMCSVREAYNEIKVRKDELEKWSKTHRDFFCDPTPEEMRFVTSIYSVPHFQQNLERKKLLKGGAFADPFIVAKAYIDNATVVTHEKYKSNAAKIPNICKHFGIPCDDLEGFLEKEDLMF